MTGLFRRVFRRVRTEPPATWTCDRCGTVNSDSVVTCVNCGA
jgi:hypothetical protein